MNRFIFTIVTILLSVVVGVLMIYPKYQILEEKKVLIENKEQELKNIEERFAEVNEALEKLENYKEELAKIDIGLPDDPSVSTLLNFIKETVAIKQLSLTSLSTNFISSYEKEDSVPIRENVNMEDGESSSAGEAALPAKTIQEIEVSLTVAGPYELFKSLLIELEESARLIEVESISFSYAGSAEGIYSFSLSLKTHSY